MSALEMQEFRGGASEWNAMLAGLPGAHVLQTWEWAEVKTRFGWEMRPYAWQTGEAAPVAAAMVLRRAVLDRGLAARLSLLYAPRGPVLDWENVALRTRVLDDLQATARRLGSSFIKMDPDLELGRGFTGQPAASENTVGQEVKLDLTRRGWRVSRDQVQFRNTVVLEISQDEEALLARMKQKTRYNIRLAEKKGVQVRVGSAEDISALYRMYAETSVRDGFVIRQPDYYKSVWETFLRPGRGESQPCADVLIAEVNGEAVAAAFVFYFARRTYYLYGMSTAAHREMMPNHLLQWAAIRRAKGRGCSSYDLWGAPDTASEDDPMWGVYRFKEGLGGDLVRTLGAWDFPVSPMWYAVFTGVVPRILDVMRARGRQSVRDSLAGS